MDTNKKKHRGSPNYIPKAKPKASNSNKRPRGVAPSRPQGQDGPNVPQNMVRIKPIARVRKNGAAARSKKTRGLLCDGMITSLQKLQGEVDGLEEAAEDLTLLDLTGGQESGGKEREKSCVDGQGKALKTDHNTHRAMSHFMTPRQELAYKGNDPRPCCYRDARPFPVGLRSIGTFMVMQEMKEKGLWNDQDNAVWLWGEPGCFQNVHILYPAINEATLGRSNFLHRTNPLGLCVCALGRCLCHRYTVAFVGPHVMRMTDEMLVAWCANMRQQGVRAIYIISPVVGTQRGSVLDDVAWEWDVDRSPPSLIVEFSDTGYKEKTVNPLCLSYTGNVNINQVGDGHLYAKVTQFGPLRALSVELMLGQPNFVLEPLPVSRLDFRLALYNTELVGPLIPNPASQGIAVTNIRPLGLSERMAVPVWTLKDHVLVKLEEYVTVGPVATEYQWVPKHLLLHLVKLVQGKSRGPKLYGELAANVRAWAKTTDLDVQEVNLAAAIPLAMMYTLDEEAAAARSCSSIYAMSQNKAIDRAIAGKAEVPWQYVACGAIGVAYLWHRFRHRGAVSPGMAAIDLTFLVEGAKWLTRTCVNAIFESGGALLGGAAVALAMSGLPIQSIVPSVGVTLRGRKMTPFFAMLKAGKFPSWYSPIQPMTKRTVLYKKCPGVHKLLPLGENNHIDTTKMDTDHCFEQPLAGEVVGFHVSRFPPVYPTSCVHSDYLALAGRQLGPQTQADERRNVMADAVNLICKYFGPVVGNINMERYCYTNRHPWHATWVGLVLPYVPQVVATPFYDWLVRFPEGKRAAFVAAHQLKGPVMKEDAKVKTFVKFEAAPKFWSGVGTAEHIPRNISSREELYQVRTGPWTHALSKRVAEVWSPSSLDGPEFATIYTSGLTAGDLGQVFQKALVRAGSTAIIFENDFSRFDGSITAELVACELAWHLAMGCDEETMQAMCWQLRCDGISAKGMKFTGEGTRKSGDGNTSVGNSFINAMVHVGPLFDATCPLVPNPSLSTMLVLGDDNLLILGFDEAPSPQQVQDLVNYLEKQQKDLGLRPKLKVVRNFLEAEFCSGLFYPAITNGDESFVWGPKLGRVLYKTGVVKADGSELKKKARSLAEYRGTLLGLQATVAHVPLLSALFNAHVRVLDNMGIRKAIYPDKIEHQIRADVPSKIHPLTWVMLSDRYGVSVSELKELHRELGKAPLGVSLHGVFNHFVSRDLGLKEEEFIYQSESPLSQTDAVAVKIDAIPTMGNVVSALKFFAEKAISMSATDFYASFVAPPLEEYARYEMGWKFTAAIIALESFELFSVVSSEVPADGQFEMAIFCVLFKVLQHGTFAVLPPKWGLLAHFINNIEIGVYGSQNFAYTFNLGAAMIMRLVGSDVARFNS